MLLHHGVVSDGPVQRRREAVRAVLRGPAEADAVVCAPKAARVGRSAPNDGRASLAGEGAPHHQAAEVIIRKVGRQHPGVLRRRQARADADMDALDLVLVPVQAAHQLPVRLR